LAKGDATIQEYPPHLTDQSSSVVDHTPTSPMQGLDVLLRDALLRHEAHAGLGDCDGDRLGIVAIILLPPPEGFDVLGRDNPDFMTEGLELPLPKEGPGAGFDADYAGRNSPTARSSVSRRTRRRSSISPFTSNPQSSNTFLARSIPIVLMVILPSCVSYGSILRRGRESRPSHQMAVEIWRHGSVGCLTVEGPRGREREAQELEGSEKAPVGRFPRITLAEQMMDVAMLKEMLGMGAGERHAFE
jgi:hypothetical protein